MTKAALIHKLAELAKRWEDGDPIDPFDAGPCTDIALIYVSKCAGELRELISGAEREINFDRKLLKLHTFRCYSPSETLDKAFEFLAEQGRTLTPDQKTALLFMFEVAYRNGNDSWDHAFDTSGAAQKRVARLLAGG